MHPDERKAYNRQYYQTHKKKIQKRIRNRYRTDDDFQERARTKARERYRQKMGIKGFGTPVPGHPFIVEHKGIWYYPLSHAVEAAEVSSQTVRRWIKVGIIPPPVQEETGRGWQFFTQVQLRLLTKMRGYSAMKKQEKEDVKQLIRERWDNGD